MCGRFLLTSPLESVQALFGVSERPNLAARYNVAPSQDIPVVRRTRDGAARELALLRWGLIPFFAKDPAIGNRMINARAEGIASRPAFREPFRRRRCLIPADGFYEWRKEGRQRQPFLVRRQDGGLFAFAGLWDIWRPEDGPGVHSCTIITGPPNEVTAPIHDRMPVILTPDDFEGWLEADPEAAMHLLRPCPAALLEAWPVGTAVNSPANEGPELIAREGEATVPPGTTPDLFD